MKKKTIQEALAEVQKKLDEAPVVSLAQLNAFRNQVGNQNATLGQYMNAQQNKTAKVGGANDPNVIARTQNLSATTGYSGGQAAKAPYVPPAAPTTTSTSPSQMGPGENRPGLAKTAAPAPAPAPAPAQAPAPLTRSLSATPPTPAQAAKGLSPSITGGGIGSDGDMPPAAKYGMLGAPALPVTTQNASGAKGSDTDRPLAPNQMRSINDRPVSAVSGNPINRLSVLPEPAPAPVEPPKANPAYDRTNSSQFSQPGLNQSGQLGYPENDTKTNPYTPPVKAKAADEETNTKGKAKVTESKLISAFFALQEKTSSNMFEAAKKLSPKQKEIASLAGDKNKIDASDLKKLRSKGLEEDEIGDMIDKMPKEKPAPAAPVPPTRPASLTPPKAKKNPDPASVTGMNTIESVEHLGEKNWIAGAIKRPSALHKALNVPKDVNIPTGKLNTAAEKGGKIGKEANLAKTLKSFHEESVEDSKEDKKADKAGEKKYGMTHKKWEKTEMDKEADNELAKKMGKKIEETKDNWEQNSPEKRKADAKTLATKTATPFQKSVSEELFSEDELNRLNEIAEAIAKTSAGDNYITQRGGEGDRLGPTLGNQMSLTDEKKSKKVSK